MEESFLQQIGGIEGELQRLGLQQDSDAAALRRQLEATVRRADVGGWRGRTGAARVGLAPA